VHLLFITYYACHPLVIRKIVIWVPFDSPVFDYNKGLGNKCCGIFVGPNTYSNVSKYCIYFLVQTSFDFSHFLDGRVGTYYT